MKKFLDKVITGFFVFAFGIAWYCTTHYFVNNKPHRNWFTMFMEKKQILILEQNFKTTKWQLAISKNTRKFFLI